MHERVESKKQETSSRKFKCFKKNKIGTNKTINDVYRENMNLILDQKMFEECGDQIEFNAPEKSPEERINDISEGY